MFEFAPYFIHCLLGFDCLSSPLKPMPEKLWTPDTASVARETTVKPTAVLLLIKGSVLKLVGPESLVQFAS